MLSDEVGYALGSAYTRESLGNLLYRWHRTFYYRWREGRIVFPLPLEESTARRRILDAGYKFLGSLLS